MKQMRKEFVKRSTDHIFKTKFDEAKPSGEIAAGACGERARASAEANKRDGLMAVLCYMEA